MGAWVALLLVVQTAGAAPVLETRYFDTSGACEAWASRLTTTDAALRPGAGHQIGACFHVRELIGRLALAR